MARRVFIVANPAAGQNNFDVKGLNTLFGDAGIDWHVEFTKQAGDGLRFARQAAEEGVDVVAAFGGDGTVAEVAGGLIGSRTPLAILPGGTANVMAVELGIPREFMAACALLAGEQLATRSVDVGEIDGRHFILRVSVGLEAKMVEGADRSLKDRLGNLAYGLSALRALRDQEIIRYEFELDGKPVVEEGIACIVANSGNLGIQGLRLSSDIDVSDGLFDVIVINNANLGTVRSLVASIFGQEGIAAPPEFEPQPDMQRTFHHWQAQQITLRSTPVESIQCDGEMIGQTPMHIRVLPAAIKAVVPVPVLAAPGVG